MLAASHCQPCRPLQCSRPIEALELNQLHCFPEHTLRFCLCCAQVVGYDLRGGTTAARALGSQGQHPAVVEVVVRQALMQVPELEQQTSIARSAVQSINLDPVDPNRLAFHLQSGWSGPPSPHNPEQPKSYVLRSNARGAGPSASEVGSEMWPA